MTRAPADAEGTPRARAGRVPLGVKCAYTAFVAVLVPVYWGHYGPRNFLYFCDVALLVTLAALWTESSTLASVEAVAITLPQTLWIADFLAFLLFRVHVLDLTGYMFDGALPLSLRALSFFHFWLPLLLLWIVRRLGYDRRAWRLQAVAGSLLLVATYVLTPLPIDPRVGNVNKVHGPAADAPQTWMPPLLWLALLVVGTIVLVYLPTHALLARWMPARRDARA